MADEVPGGDDVGDDATPEPGAPGDPDEVRAAEQKFLEAREAWFKERDAAAEGD